MYQNEESNVERAIRLQREYPVLSEEETALAEGRWPLQAEDSNEFSHFIDDYWYGDEENPKRLMLDIPGLTPYVPKRERQVNYLRQVIDTVRKDLLPRNHSSAMSGIARVAIESLQRGVHVEIIADLVTLLRSKLARLCSKYVKTNEIIMEHMSVTPSIDNTGEEFPSYRVRIQPSIDTGAKTIWLTGLYERSYAGGGIYNAEIDEHEISILLMSTFHLSREVREYSTLLSAGIHEIDEQLRKETDIDVQLRKETNDRLKIEMAIVFAPAYRNSVSLSTMLRSHTSPPKVSDVAKCGISRPLHWEERSRFYGYSGHNVFHLYKNASYISGNVRYAFNIVLYGYNASQIQLIRKNSANLRDLCEKRKEMHNVYMMP